MNPHVALMLLSTTSGRMFGLDQQTVIQIGIQLLNSSILAGALAFLLYRPVRDFMRKRADKIKSQLDRAGEDMVKANEMKLEYEQKLRDIERERDEILDSARKTASDRTRKMLDEARAEAQKIKDNASADIEMERLNAKDEMKQAILEIACAMAAKFVERAIDPEIQSRLFDETVAEMEETTWRS